MSNYIKYIELKNTINGVVDAQENNFFHVAYGSDKNYQLGTAISIVSIVKNNPQTQCHYCFHLFSNEFEPQYVERLSKIAVDLKVNIKLYQVDESILNHLPVSAIWPLSIYYRLLAFDYLSMTIDKVLYLDSDVICKGSISFLEELSLYDNYAAVVPDIASTQEKTFNRIGVDFNNKYFNSGFILSNLEQWRKNKLTDKIFDFFNNEGRSDKIKYPDQDALNIILMDKLEYLSQSYNTIYSLKSEFEFKQPEYYKTIIKNDTVFIHYTGVTKPWHIWADYPASVYFRNMYQLSPWKSDLYLAAKTKNEFKEEYKHYLYQGKYLKALVSLLKYKF